MPKSPNRYISLKTQRIACTTEEKSCSWATLNSHYMQLHHHKVEFHRKVIGKSRSGIPWVHRCKMYGGHTF